MSFISPFNSLQQNLTNSIRRAKEKIYSHSFTNYPPTESQSQVVNIPTADTRQRTASNHAYNQRIGKEEGNALAGAMKTLQQKIAVLEQEKKELNLQEPGQKGKKEEITGAVEERERIEKDIRRLSSVLREKQSQLKKLNRANSDLSCKNADLMDRILELQEQLQRVRRGAEQTLVHQLDTQHRDSSSEAITQAIMTEKDLHMVELQFQLKQSQTRNTLSHLTIQKLMSQLQQQKRTNRRWIKLHEQQLLEQVQKENSNIEVNRVQPPQKGTKIEGRKDYSQLLKNNKEMYETIQRNKVKMQEIGRQIKESSERYAKLKLLVGEIVQNVNKMMPHPNTHLRFLMNRIQKLDNVHLQSLRSFSNHSRRSLLRNSHSNQRKKSLKMSDLNSSSKKSHERSAGKSSGKKKILQQQLSHSQKKPRLVLNDEELQQQILEKEVRQLKKQHRNLIVKAEKNNVDGEITRKLQEVMTLFGQKQKRLQQLKALKNIKRELIMT